MDPAELAARRIADRGRDALVERLRVAFAATAATRAGPVEIDSRQLEQMVQTAADRAGGALWRRALASVAVDELGITLSEAAEHPAVRRAQEILGVPAYEPDEVEAEPEPAPEPEPALSAIRVAAIHLGGIETLREGARHIELRFSDAGLDVIDTRGGESIGRLKWAEIAGLELPHQRRSLRRRRPAGAELVVRTDRGQARFELPDLDDEQARKHLAPVLDRARGVRS